MPKTRLFVGIAVQSPHGLKALPGVHDALDRMAEFARQSDKYDDPILISDKDEAVTAARIKSLLPADVLLDRQRINVYFCGHGAFQNGAEIWYLTDGTSYAEERVDVMAFRSVLDTYGPEQVSLFSDACQSLVHHPTKASAVLREHKGNAARPDYDLFRATIEGEDAFATETDGPLFSKAMSEALSSTPPDEAIDELILGAMGRRVVSSQSLKIYVKSNLPDYAAAFGRNQHPEMHPGYVFDTNDYFEPALPPGDIDPSPHPVDGMVQPFGGTIETPISLRNRSDDRIEEALIDSVSEWRGPFWAEATETAERLPDARFLARIEGYAETKSATIQLHLADRDDAILPSDVIDGYAVFPQNLVWDPDLPQRSGVLQIDDIYVPLALGISWNLTLIANVFVDNPGPADASGAHVLGWHEVGMGNPPSSMPSPMQILKGMLNGYLGADAIAPMAARLRMMKHSDPLFGIVAAYLYHRAGDVASIQRMCYFYAEYGQAVPFDIALLARLPLSHDDQGGFVFDVPEVAEDPYGKERNLPYYAWQATEARQNLAVSGVLPLLSTGWSQLWTLFPQANQTFALDRFRDALTEAPFASVKGNNVGQDLVQTVRAMYRDA
ncbi:MAG: hypothetical protein AAFW87_03285 [Pseudomonadota bacterium]